MAARGQGVDVQEHIARTVRQLNKAETLFRVEPLHRSVDLRAETGRSSAVAGCVRRRSAVARALAVAAAGFVERRTVRTEIVVEAATARFATAAMVGHAQEKLVLCGGSTGLPGDQTASNAAIIATPAAVPRSPSPASAQHHTRDFCARLATTRIFGPDDIICYRMASPTIRRSATIPLSRCRVGCTRLVSKVQASRA